MGRVFDGVTLLEPGVLRLIELPKHSSLNICREREKSTCILSGFDSALFFM